MSSIARLTLVALVLCPTSGLVVRQQGDAPKQTYKLDCWQKRPVALSQAAVSVWRGENPGAGIDKFTPFTTVEKDGFSEATCVKDYMYSHGDKFGDNRHSYKIGQSSNVSIVHYAAFVAKEDRQPMTPKVCFEFCRTVPQMGFFGITNGRDCYCTPYYKPMESDSSICDATCEGDATLFCGGKSKSTVFSMHMCANTAAELGDAVKQADRVTSDEMEIIKMVKKLSTDMQKSADRLQKSFGGVGDAATTNLMQDAKVFAGKLLHTAEDVEKHAGKLNDLSAKAKGITKFNDPNEVTKAEGIVSDIEKNLAKGDKVVVKLDKVKDLAKPPDATKDASKQYTPVMYFIDKSQDKTPQTCGGDTVAKPIVGGSLDQCATACDKLTQQCVGFSFYQAAPENLCFLFSKFKTAFYYTGCKGKVPKVQCLAKFSEFEGTTLKPDGSGKCKQCLKKLTKADRCFATASKGK